MAKESRFSPAAVGTAAAVGATGLVLTYVVARVLCWILRGLRAVQEKNEGIMLSDTARAAADQYDWNLARVIAFGILSIVLLVAFWPKLKDFLTG